MITNILGLLVGFGTALAICLPPPAAPGPGAPEPEDVPGGAP
jgi:hypothetical protein